MNVFEDLIEELRDENLLERTVIDPSGPAGATSNGTDAKETTKEAGTRPATENGSDVSRVEPGFDLPGADRESESDFYRKRAMDEVSSLQMVEHIVSAIEREHMKIVPAVYDDLEAKKALHRFLQVHSDPTTTDYAEAEFKLMHETESWSSALSLRDQKISVSNLRRYCENSRPVLSSQALLALGRFYRNATYSELSRAKFEVVMTRLFSRPIDEEKRSLLFGRSEMTGHIKSLYANWSSIALYTEDDASLKIRAIVAGFDDRVAEAETAETFEQLIQDAFFDKIHEFKEAAGEMFFVPEIVAATIECNIRIGNKFVDVIQLEHESTNRGSVEKKYGYEYDQVISDAAGKTLQLAELLKSLPGLEPQETRPVRSEPRPAARAAAVAKGPSLKSDLFRVNK